MNKRLQSLLVFLPPLCFFFALGFWYVYPFSQRTVTYSLGDHSPFIQSPLPKERVSAVLQNENGDRYIVLHDEPVYVSVVPPAGNFDRMKVKVFFDTGDASIFALGTVTNFFTQAIDLRPFANTVLENLKKQGWGRKVVTLAGTVQDVWMKESDKEMSVGQVRNDQIAVYRASLPWASPSGPFTASSPITYTFPLRGSHEFFTAVGDGDGFSLTAHYHDENTVPGSDAGVITMYGETGEVIATAAVTDDGTTAELSADGVPAGVYRVVFAVTTDIVWDTFVTKARYWVVKNTVNISQGKTSMTLNTNMKALTFVPKNADSLEGGTLNGAPLAFTEVGKKISMNTTNALSWLTLQDGELQITGEGFFGLANMPFFVPEPAGFGNFLADPDSYSVIVAAPSELVRDGDWRVGETDFDLLNLPQENGGYKLVFSAPLVHEEGGGVRIHKIQVTFEKDVNVLGVLKSIRHLVKEVIF